MDNGAEQDAARRIQRAIGKILLEDWDPIGVRDVPEAQDEYDGYVGGIYRLLASGATAASVAEHLCTIEAGMGLTPARTSERLSVATKLCGVNVGLEHD